MPNRRIAARSTLYLNSLVLVILAALALGVAGCGAPVRIAKPPPERLVCEALPAPPRLTQLDWDAVQSVGEAKALVFAREGETAGYIVRLRAAWFSCSATVGWHRDYVEALP